MDALLDRWEWLMADGSCEDSYETWIGVQYLETVLPQYLT